MSRQHRSCASVAAFAFVLLAAIPARADVITMSDGRVYEGHVLGEKDGKLKIDTKVSGTRVVLGLPRIDVKSIDMKPVPAGFFERPPAEARMSDPAKSGDPSKQYLEVPVIGEFGKQFNADGLAQVLTYAKRWRIGHLVFVIDSAGGDRDEAREIYGLLEENARDIRYHAIVKKCQAEALVIAVWCRPALILPGGILGGFPKVDLPAADSDEALQKEILWSQLAERVISDTKASGHIATLLRALINPAEELAVWKDDEGNLAFDAEFPADVAKDKAILQVKKGEFLALTREKALALGMVDFKGSAADLGPILKVKEWAPESQYGVVTITRAIAERERKLKVKQDSLDRKVKQVSTRRDSTEAYIEDSIRQASEWDPVKDTYSSYAESWNWGAGWTGGWTSNKWTPESQRKWKSRTDAAMYFLKEAAKGLTAMKKLDAEAVKLGLDPLYPPGEIDTIIRNLDIRYQDLQKNRTKSSE